MYNSRNYIGVGFSGSTFSTSYGIKNGNDARISVLIYRP